MSTMGSKVQAAGLQSAKIMIVGDAPSRQDEVAGQPFSGGAGDVLRNTLGRIGVPETNVFYTNLSKHRPPSNDLRSWFDAAGMPAHDHLRAGLKELREEVDAVNPNVIVAMGNYPLWFLSNKARWSKKYGYTGIGDWRGSIMSGRAPIFESRKIVASYQPAAILRKWSWLPMLELDLMRAKEQSLFPEIKPLNKNLMVDVQGTDRLIMMDRLMNHGPFITFDIEMLGSNLMCCSFTSDKDEAFVIRTKSGTDLKFIRDILESGRPLCAQNAMFDVSMLEYWHKIRAMRHIKHDTMLASHSAYIEQPKDLGYLCSIYTEQPCYWTEVNWNTVKKNPDQHADTIDFQTYNAIDAWVTHDVAEQQLADELKDPNVKATFEFEMELLSPLWDIARKGITVDKKRMASIQRSCEVAIVEKGGRLNEIAGKPLNVASNQQVAKFLFEQLALPVQKLTDAKKPSADDFVLADLDLLLPEGEKKEAVQLLRAVRKSRSLISKFTTIEYDADGRMRCHYNIGGTVTGRLASKKFYPTDTGANLQNIPRDKEVRSVFIPDPGFTFFYNDLERAESLVVAKLTGDPLMLEDHEPGKDAHRRLAARLYSREEEDISKDQRYMGKQTRHAGNYMEGPKIFQRNVNKIAASTGVEISLKEAKFFIGAYREMHPFLQKWWDDTMYRVKHTGILYNLCAHKRPRRFYDRIENCLPAAIAYVPQSTIGDTLNMAIIKAEKDEVFKATGAQILVQVHDAIGGQVPHENAETAMAMLKDLMNVTLTVPRTGEEFAVAVEIATGPSWGEVTAW